MKILNPNKLGVSLVEVMIGVFLLALILIPSLNVVISQTKTVNATRDHAQAAFVASTIIETARGWEFKLLDKEDYKKYYKDDTNKTEANTLEFLLTTDKENEYNTYNLNGITYKIDKSFTCFDAIYNKGADKEKSFPSVYTFKYRIVYNGQDGKNHNLDVYTVLSPR